MKALGKQCIVLGFVCVVATVAFAEQNWELPEGVDGGEVLPAPLPEGMFGPVTFTEDEFPYGTVIDALVVTTLNGNPLPAPLAFGFSSLDAIVNGGPGDITYVQLPNIEGDSTGTLIIDLGLDATSVTFGFALACGAPIADGATAQALDGQDGPVGSPVSVDALDFGSGFAENQINLAPGGTFRSVEITFYPGDDCGRFAFDNLAYDAQPVPTLRPVWFVALAVLLIGAGVSVLSLRRA